MTVRPVEKVEKAIDLIAGDIVLISVPATTATAKIMHKRIGDTSPYDVNAVEIVTNGTYDVDVKWTVSEDDASVIGTGRARIVCKDATGSVVMSATYRTITRGTDTFSDIPKCEAESWVSHERESRNMVLLNDFTTSEQEDFSVEQTDGGVDYNLDSAFVYVTFPEFTGSVTSPYIMFGSGNTYVGLAICGAASKGHRWCSCIKDDSPFWICNFVSGGTSRTYSALNSHCALMPKDDYPSITRIYSYQGRPFPVGTRIRIYGRQRDV